MNSKLDDEERRRTFRDEAEERHDDDRHDVYDRHDPYDRHDLYDRALGWFRRDPMRPIAGSRRWRRGGGIWLIYLVSPLGQAWTHHRLVASFAGTALLIAFACVYLFAIPRSWTRGGHTSYRVAGALLALGLACAAVIGPSGLATLIYVAAASLVALPARIAVPSAAIAAVATTVVPQYITPWHVDHLMLDLGVAIALAALAIFSYSRLIDSNRQLAAAREEVAHLAAERERLRIARDLHDLLGHSLTTITVKSALARRLVQSDPERAISELAEVEQLARESLADTRAAVAGYREVRLATELATAREVLSAAGIQAELPRVVDDVPADLGGLFGWAVREGITNVVRHSRARSVRISLHGRAIEIVDDGRGMAQRPGDRSGHGLAGLAERAAALGGRLVTGPASLGESPAGFRLRVEVP